MSEPETLPGHIHPEAALLPWYLNGTLGDAESRQVAGHLQSCAACRSELDELSNVKTSLSAIYAAQPGPSTSAARSLFNTVAQEASSRRATRANQGSWMERVDQWFRTLFLPQWVPTLAAAVLIAQIGLLLWTAMPVTQPDQITTRGLGRQTSRLSVVFHKAATEEQIRSLLHMVDGTIVNGPTPDGRYTIEVPAGDAETSQKKLDVLRGRTDVVISADRGNP